MPTTEPPARVAVPIATLAAEISVTPDQICRWIAAGHLPAFVSPGDREPGGRGRPPQGRKGYRVWRDDWERFCRAQTKTVAAKPEPEGKPAGAGGRWAVCGTDGVSRLKRGRKTT